MSANVAAFSVRPAQAGTQPFFEGLECMALGPRLRGSERLVSIEPAGSPSRHFDKMDPTGEIIHQSIHLTAMKIDVHSHQIEKFFHETLAALPGVTVKLNPDRFSYLMKDGKTWLPFRPEMFDPDHLIREMDRKGIDISILSMN